MTKQDRDALKQVGFWALLSLTLGLAPFLPEPHLLGKLRWLAGGAQGMAPMDAFDLLLHGFPWVMLFLSSGRLLKSKLGSGTDKK